VLDLNNRLYIGPVILDGRPAQLRNGTIQCILVGTNGGPLFQYLAKQRFRDEQPAVHWGRYDSIAFDECFRNKSCRKLFSIAPKVTKMES
jgi:hypothetical protein